jgi:hypothetical protein
MAKIHTLRDLCAFWGNIFLKNLFLGLKLYFNANHGLNQNIDFKGVTFTKLSRSAISHVTCTLLFNGITDFTDLNGLF